jgi:hypothetical protein
MNFVENGRRFTVAIAMSSFGVLVIVAIILTLKCHVNIKNYIYLLRVKRGRRQGYIPISNHDDFQYHAFVVYCDEDRHWVEVMAFSMIIKTASLPCRRLLS